MVDSGCPGAERRTGAPHGPEPAEGCGSGPEREMRKETTMTVPITAGARAAHPAAATCGMDPIELLRRSAWVPVMRGTLSIAFGAGALVGPDEAGAVLLAAFGAYAFLDGILATYAGMTMASRHPGWLAVRLEGILGIAAGIIAYHAPGLTAAALLDLFAAWAVLRGILEIAT